MVGFGGTWRNMAGFSGTWQNMAEYGRLPSDCRRLLLDCRLEVGLWLLSRWKQVDVYKVSRECPVTAYCDLINIKVLAKPKLPIIFIANYLNS
jgi:hypothetical protein